MPISLDRDDCERARIALRQLSVEPTVPDEIEFAAVALEVELERPLQSARRRNRSLTLTLDAADCALIALALLHASDYDDEGADPDAYRCQASRLLGRIDGATPESFDGPSG